MREGGDQLNCNHHSGSYLSERIGIAIERGNAASLLGIIQQAFLGFRSQSGVRNSTLRVVPHALGRFFI